MREWESNSSDMTYAQMCEAMSLEKEFKKMERLRELMNELPELASSENSTDG